MNKMELHKDNMQLLLIVLAHGLNIFVFVAVLFSLPSLSLQPSLRRRDIT